MRTLTPIIAAAVAVVATIGPSSSLPALAVQDDWVETIRAKRWITAFLGKNGDATPAPVDRVVALIGGRESIIYRATVMDQTLGWPIVSPDGTHVAFVKTDGTHRQLCAMSTDGSALRTLVALYDTGDHIRGAATSSSVAWTHDNRALALVGRLASEPSAARQPDGPAETLWRVDSRSGDVTRLKAVETRMVGNSIAGMRITAQAWAPDGRRLVFGDSSFHAIIHDTATGADIDLGPGLDPTWSPDGRFIAVRMPNSGSRLGDYMIVEAQPPHRRTLLVSNAPTLLSWGGPRYVTDPVWLPDSDGVFLYRYRRLMGTPYVVRRTTGEATRLPFTFLSYSWGGQP